MKARVKATGEIVEVNEFCALRDSGERTYYWANALELITKDNPDYWTRLEHTYAGMAIQGMLSCKDFFMELGNIKGMSTEDALAKAASTIAHALVEKMKEERK